VWISIRRWRSVPDGHCPGSFFLMGVVSMAWVPRIPEIKAALGLSDGEFGVVLVSSSVGAVIGAHLAGRLIQRFGSRNLMRFAQAALPLGVLLMGLAPSLYVLALGLFFMGLGSAAMDIPGNAQAVVIERLVGKKFLASLHAALHAHRQPLDQGQLISWVACTATCPLGRHCANY
jgi:MFS family permease